MLVSIIAPAYNEEGNIAAFARAAAEAFRDLPEGWSLHASVLRRDTSFLGRCPFS